jgi:hypothetical protein
VKAESLSPFFCRFELVGLKIISVHPPRVKAKVKVKMGLFEPIIVILRVNTLDKRHRKG